MAAKMGESLNFSRALERRPSQGVTWFVQTVKRQDWTRRHRRDEQAQEGKSETNNGKKSQREREAGAGGSKTDVTLKQKALKHHPLGG